MLQAVQNEVIALGKELLGTLRVAGLPLKALSLEMGYHPQYLSRAFRGAHPLKVEVVFRVLSKARVDPAAFFEGLYPFGGEGAKFLGKQPSHVHPTDQYLSARRELQRRQLAAHDMTPEAWSDRAGRLLRRMLQRRGVSQGSASRALELGPANPGACPSRGDPAHLPARLRDRVGVRRPHRPVRSGVVRTSG